MCHFCAALTIEGVRNVCLWGFCIALTEKALILTIALLFKTRMVYMEVYFEELSTLPIILNLTANV